MQKHFTILLYVAALCGCATTSSNTGPQTDVMSKIESPVQISDGVYKLGGPGNATDSSGTAVKVRLMQQATTFCSSKSLAMAPGKSTTKDASAGVRASAEVQFRCVPK